MENSEHNFEEINKKHSSINPLVFQKIESLLKSTFISDELKDTDIKNVANDILTDQIKFRANED